LDLKARAFNCIIELWETEETADGFGGLTISGVKVADVYARREELKRNPYLENGQNITQQVYRFHIRSRRIVSGMFIVYKGLRYDINDRHFTQLQTQIVLDCINTGFFTQSVSRIFNNKFNNKFA